MIIKDDGAAVAAVTAWTRFNAPDYEALELWSERMRRAIRWPAAGQRGGARAWFERRLLHTVETFQITVDTDTSSMSGLFIPGPRRVVSVTPTRVALDNSARRFRGLRTFLSIEDTLITTSGWGEDRLHVCVYFEGEQVNE